MKQKIKIKRYNCYRLVFFKLKKTGWAFLNAILLWGSIAWTIWEFRKEDDIAAKLLYPYIGWVTAAVYLNGYIAINN